jgi:hypothetical protein
MQAAPMLAGGRPIASALSRPRSERKALNGPTPSRGQRRRPEALPVTSMASRRLVHPNDWRPATLTVVEHKRSKRAAIREQGREPSHPPVDGDVIDLNAAFGQHVFDATVDRPWRSYQLTATVMTTARVCAAAAAGRMALAAGSLLGR